MAAALTVRLPLLCILLMCLASVTTIQAQLSTNFYRSTCKDAETIISVAVTSALSRRPAAAAGIIRMLFHDCFVHVSSSTSHSEYHILVKGLSNLSLVSTATRDWWTNNLSIVGGLFFH